MNRSKNLLDGRVSQQVLFDPGLLPQAFYGCHKILARGVRVRLEVKCFHSEQLTVPASYHVSRG